MKNMFKKVLVLMLSFLTLTSLVSCGKNDMEKFFDNITGEDANFEVAVETSFMGLNVEMKMQVDGNIAHTDAFLGSAETYTEKVDKKFYSYTKVGETWVKEEIPMGSNDIGMMEMDDLTADDFTKEDDKWILNEEKAKELQVSELVVTFGEKLETAEMKAKFTEEGLSFGATYKFSKFGEIKLTLPKVK